MRFPGFSVLESFTFPGFALAWPIIDTHIQAWPHLFDILVERLDKPEIMQSPLKQPAVNRLG